MSDNESATKNFLEAIDYAKQINAYSLQAFAQKGLAQVYTLEGKYNKAIAILEEASKVSGNVNDLVLNQEIYKGLSENYLAINEWDNYQTNRTKYLKTQTELKQRERKSVSDSLNEKEKEENKKLENAIPNFLIGIVITFLIIILILIFFVLSVSKSKRTIEQLEIAIKSLQNAKLSSDN
jgi:tetratricopeptide (TPR) repeat protein